ncbi:MAG: response regulator [Lachnospiraceae bacterium]|nr:response regulator [Lachnospiraceae bacterium]
MYKVLIVEDELAIRFIYRNMKEWKEYGFEICAEAEDGKKAMELLQKEHFDLMLLDVVLPNMDGLALLEELERKNIAVTTVIASTYNEFEYARKGMQHGAMDYLVKPIQKEELAACLKKIKKNLETDYIKGEEHRLLLACGLDLDDSFVRKLEKYVEEQGELILGNLADYYGFSKDYFGKIFRQKVGMTFQQFVMKYKMEQAKRLLLVSNYKIYEISDQLGYRTTDYFTKLFRDYTGMSPQKYRKTRGKNTDL